MDWVENPYDAAEGADALVMLTEWNEFRALDLGRMSEIMAKPRLADLRNVYSPTAVREAGFVAYTSIGRDAFEETAQTAAAE